MVKMLFWRYSPLWAFYRSPATAWFSTGIKKMLTLMFMSTLGPTFGKTTGIAPFIFQALSGFVSMAWLVTMVPLLPSVGWAFWCIAFPINLVAGLGAFSLLPSAALAVAGLCSLPTVLYRNFRYWHLSDIERTEYLDRWSRYPTVFSRLYNYFRRGGQQSPYFTIFGWNFSGLTLFLMAAGAGFMSTRRYLRDKKVPEARALEESVVTTAFQKAIAVVTALSILGGLATVTKEALQAVNVIRAVNYVVDSSRKVFGTDHISASKEEVDRSLSELRSQRAGLGSYSAVPPPSNLSSMDDIDKTVSLIVRSYVKRDEEALFCIDPSSVGVFQTTAIFLARSERVANVHLKEVFMSMYLHLRSLLPGKSSNEVFRLVDYPEQLARVTPFLVPKDALHELGFVVKSSVDSKAEASDPKSVWISLPACSFTVADYEQRHLATDCSKCEKPMCPWGVCTCSSVEIEAPAMPNLTVEESFVEETLNEEVRKSFKFLICSEKEADEQLILLEALHTTDILDPEGMGFAVALFSIRRALQILYTHIVRFCIRSPGIATASLVVITGVIVGVGCALYFHSRKDDSKEESSLTSPLPSPVPPKIPEAADSQKVRVIDITAYHGGRPVRRALRLFVMGKKFVYVRVGDKFDPRTDWIAFDKKHAPLDLRICPLSEIACLEPRIPSGPMPEGRYVKSKAKRGGKKKKDYGSPAWNDNDDFTLDDFADRRSRFLDDVAAAQDQYEFLRIHGNEGEAEFFSENVRFSRPNPYARFKPTGPIMDYANWDDALVEDEEEEKRSRIKESLMKPDSGVVSVPADVPAKSSEIVVVAPASVLPVVPTQALDGAVPNRLPESPLPEKKKKRRKPKKKSSSSSSVLPPQSTSKLVEAVKVPQSFTPLVSTGIKNRWKVGESSISGSSAITLRAITRTLLPLVTKDGHHVANAIGCGKYIITARHALVPAGVLSSTPVFSRDANSRLVECRVAYHTLNGKRCVVEWPDLDLIALEKPPGIRSASWTVHDGLVDSALLAAFVPSQDGLSSELSFATGSCSKGVPDSPHQFTHFISTVPGCSGCVLVDRSGKAFALHLGGFTTGEANYCTTVPQHVLMTCGALVSRPLGGSVPPVGSLENK